MNCLEKASVLGSFPVGLRDSRLDCAYLVSSCRVAYMGDLRRNWMPMVIPHSYDIHVGSVAEEVIWRPIEF